MLESRIVEFIENFENRKRIDNKGRPTDRTRSRPRILHARRLPLANANFMEDVTTWKYFSAVSYRFKTYRTFE